MSEHIKEQLGAYLDGELHSRHLRQVETHLDECRTCFEEYEALQALSVMLQDATLPEFQTAERLAAEVALHLPRTPLKPVSQTVLEFGWWLAPVGLILAWIFISTTLWVGELITTANQLGLLGNASAWLASEPTAAGYWSGMLGQFGLLAGDNLQWVEVTESFTRNNIPQIIWQASIALLYLSWMAIWWARYARQGYRHPLNCGSMPTG